MEDGKVFVEEILSAELEHHGVKGMRWGVRKERKLNRASRKAAKKSNRSKTYRSNLQRSMSGAIKTLSPTQYARYLTSGSTQSQIARDKRLAKSAERGENKVKNLLREYGGDYIISYNPVTETYSISDKK